MKSSHPHNDLIWNQMKRGVNDYNAKIYATLQSSYGRSVIDYCAEKGENIPRTDSKRNFTDHCGDWSIIGWLSILIFQS